MGVDRSPALTAWDGGRDSARRSQALSTGPFHGEIAVAEDGRDEGQAEPSQGPTDPLRRSCHGGGLLWPGRFTSREAKESDLCCQKRPQLQGVSGDVPILGKDHPSSLSNVGEPDVVMGVGLEVIVEDLDSLALERSSAHGFGDYAFP